MQRWGKVSPAGSPPNQVGRLRLKSRSRSTASEGRRPPRLARIHQFGRRDRTQDGDRRRRRTDGDPGPETQTRRPNRNRARLARPSVGTWLIVGSSTTNRRRVNDHRTILASTLPGEGRSLRTLFQHPESGPISGIAFWPNLPEVRVNQAFATPQRVWKRRVSAAVAEPRSGAGPIVPG